MKQKTSPIWTASTNEFASVVANSKKLTLKSFDTTIYYYMYVSVAEMMETGMAKS